MSDEQSNSNGSSSQEHKPEQVSTGRSASSGMASSSPTEQNVETPSLNDLQASSTPHTKVNGNQANPDLEVILDIPVNLSMEVGQTSISIRDLLKLNHGSVIELEKIAGEPLDVHVNGTLIAHGEVVVVNEKFGIRLTDVLSAQERIQKISDAAL